MILKHQEPLSLEFIFTALFLSSLLPMRGDYLRLCLCSGLGGKVADDLEMGPASWGQQSAGCWMGGYGSQDNVYMKLLLEFICSWCYYLFGKKMKFAYPTVSLKSSHPIMARENTRIIVSINRDNDSNLLWQKQRKFCFRSSSFENADAHFLCTTIPTASHSYRANEIDKSQ